MPAEKRDVQRRFKAAQLARLQQYQIETRETRAARAGKRALFSTLTGERAFRLAWLTP